LLLRDLEPEVIGVLRARAERSGRSLQQELHAALRRDAKRNFDEAAAISAAWRERLRGRDLPDTTGLLREDRSR
jgi:plasmid stability protein